VDVQHSYGWPDFLDQAPSLLAIARFANETQCGVTREDVAQTAPEDGVIIGD